MGESTEPVTQVLEAVGAGEEHAAEKLLPLVYEELRRLAAPRWPTRRLARRCNPPRWCMRPGCGWWRRPPDTGQNRRHFFAAAAEAMRRILVERARRKQCAQARRRDSNAWNRGPSSTWPPPPRMTKCWLVNEALEQLEH